MKLQLSHNDKSNPPKQKKDIPEAFADRSL